MYRKISVFIRRKFREIFKNNINKRDIELLKDKNFVIISDNCWGGSLYQWYKRPYNTPFAGVGVYGDCYIKLLTNFDYYMEQELTFINKSKYPERELNYPLALLDDIEIHFRHNKNEEEAKIKWDRRKKRMLEETNKDNYYFKICTAWSATEEHIKKFHSLPFKNKLSYSLSKIEGLNTKDHIKIIEKNKKDNTLIPNGKKLFKLTFLYFDLNNWLLRS